MRLYSDYNVKINLPTISVKRPRESWETMDDHRAMIAEPLRLEILAGIRNDPRWLEARRLLQELRADHGDPRPRKG